VVLPSIHALREDFSCYVLFSHTFPVRWHGVLAASNQREAAGASLGILRPWKIGWQ